MAYNNNFCKTGRSKSSPMTKVLNHTNTKCWPGHAPKAGEPKTKISSRTGQRVNNCSSK